MPQQGCLMSLRNTAPRSGGDSGRGLSIRGHCSRWGQPISVAWLYSPLMEGSGWFRTRDFTFGVAILEYDPGPDKELRAVLEGWANAFKGDSFTTDASSKGIHAWAVGYEAAVQHIDLLVDRLSKVLAELRQL